MNINDLVPASSLATQSGVKMLAFGAPGSGKTPIAATAPTPVILAVESGMLSMRGQDTPTFKADTFAQAEDFLQWWHTSREAEQFETLCVDSLSHLAHLCLQHEMSVTKHGPAAYGELSKKIYAICERIFNQPEKHAYLICQQGTVEENGVMKRRPAFPGQDLNTKIPHLFDLIGHVGLHPVPGMPGPVQAIRCQPGYDILARDRSGRLREFEPPILSHIFETMSAKTS